MKFEYCFYTLYKEQVYHFYLNKDRIKSIIHPLRAEHLSEKNTNRINLNMNLLVLLLALVICVELQQYEINPVYLSDVQYIRLNEIRELEQPNIRLNKIYRRQVYKVAQISKQSNQSTIEQFQVCRESPPEISFKNIGYYRLDQPLSVYSDTQQITNLTELMRKTGSIIYDYQVLKNKYQNIIDMIHYDNLIFTISSSANLNVYSLTGEEDGIQLKASIKGIDWQGLYQYRYQGWLLRENKQKDRQYKMQQQKQSNQQTINTTDINTSSQNKTNSDQSLNNTQTDSGKTRVLYEPSPKVYSQNESIQGGSDPKVSQSEQPSDESTKYQSLQSNSTDQSQIYYTGAPPSPPKQYLHKGYFTFMDNNKLLIFANNQYLIGYDVNKNWTFLLSEQPQYDYLFDPKNMPQNISGKTNNQTNSTANQRQSKEMNSSKNWTANNEVDSTESQASPSDQQQAESEFIPLQVFESITKINQTHFALIDKKKAIYIYQITQSKPYNFLSYSNNPSNYFLKLTQTITKQHFNKSYQQNEELNIVDIQFDLNKSLLLVLDYQKGVFAFQNTSKSPNDNLTNLSNSDNTPYSSNDSLSLSSQFVLSPYRIIKRMCNLMAFSQLSQQIFLSCNKIYRISLQKWPVIKQKVYPHPLINIRQIYIENEKNIVILSGYSVFKVMYLDRTANYFQDDMLDKIIFNNDIVITANQNHIIALKYRVQKPAIVCQALNRSSIGTHNILIRTTAECSETYLKQINYTLASDQVFDENDICVYNVYKSIYIWQQGQVPLKPLAIVMLVFLIFISVMIIWFVLIKLRMQRARQHIRYLSQEGHKTLVEEQDGKKSASQPQISGKGEDLSSTNKQSQSINQEEQDHNKDLYSIE